MCVLTYNVLTQNLWSPVYLKSQRSDRWACTLKVKCSGRKIHWFVQIISSILYFLCISNYLNKGFVIFNGKVKCVIWEIGIFVLNSFRRFPLIFVGKPLWYLIWQFRLNIQSSLFTICLSCNYRHLVDATRKIILFGHQKFMICVLHFVFSLTGKVIPVETENKQILVRTHYAFSENLWELLNVDLKSTWFTRKHQGYHLSNNLEMFIFHLFTDVVF